MEKVMRNEGLWHIIEHIFGYLNYEAMEIFREVFDFWNESLQKIALIKYLEELEITTIASQEAHYLKYFLEE